MKINTEALQQLVQQHQQASNPAPGADFAAALDRALEQPQCAGSGIDAARKLEATPCLLVDGPEQREEIVAEVSRFFDTLEQYGANLASDVAVDRLQPLVAAVECDAQALAACADSLPHDDTLRGIIDEALIRANVEMARFHRGDYR